jgi:superfamily II DNA or RNA helicase
MGKTVIFAFLIKHRHELDGNAPALVLVHRDELVRQAEDKIRSIAPELRIGVVKAERNETDADVIIASVQTLAREKRRSQLWIAIGFPSMIIMDECHHAVARTYQEILEEFGAFLTFEDTDGEIDPTPTVGFTATLARGDEVGLGDVWQSVAYTRDILHGIMAGHLSDVKGKRVQIQNLDLNKVQRSRGDYQADDLGSAMIESGAGELIAEAYTEHAKDRQGILFTPNVASAYTWARDLQRSGVKSAVIEGNTPVPERQEIYKEFRDGKIQVLSNCMVLTEGFDMPQASCAVIARPTTSASLYIQMVGRVLRPWPGKENALVLDVVGASGRHKLAALVDLAPGQVTEEEVLEEELSLLEGSAKQEERKVLVSAEAAMEAQEVDMFDRSSSAWLRTYKGVWFIPTKAATWFLWEEPKNPGLYAVGRIPNEFRSSVAWPHRSLTMEYAMSWAEQEAEAEDHSISSKSASWRKAKAQPSEAQKNLAQKLRLTFTPATTKAELSNMISIALASRQLDPKVKK